MKREIKFRAWDLKRMTTSGIMFNTTTGELVVPDESRMVLMQFTGLHDKNGKEIYESDLIKIADTYTNRSAKGVSVVVFSSEYVGGWVATTDYKNKLNLGSREKYVEVVGNIYENPKLLK